MIICSICLEDFESKKKQVVTIKCGHVFHDDCIQRWYQENLTPMGHYENIPKLPDVLDCPVCNVKHPYPEFRKIYLTENTQPKEYTSVSAEARIRELEEQCRQLEVDKAKLVRNFSSGLSQLLPKCVVKMERINLNVPAQAAKVAEEDRTRSIENETTNENPWKEKLSRGRGLKRVRRISQTAMYRVNVLDKSFFTHPSNIKRKRV